MNRSEIGRYTNLDLLKIIAMIMVLTTHYLGHGNVLSNVIGFTFNYYISWFIEAFSFVAVNIYVLISGYFLIEANFKFKKILYLWGEIVAYSTIIYLVLVVLKKVDFNAIYFIKTLFPISSRRYGFATNYISLYILFPFLNIFIKSLSREKLIFCIVVMMILLSIWPNLMFFSDPFRSLNGDSLIWFVFLYFISAYIRMYKETIPIKYNWLGLFYIFSFITLGSKVFISYLTNLLFGRVIGSGLFYSNTRVFILLAAISLFLYFLSIKIEHGLVNNIVIKLSKATFGVYLIQEQPELRQLIWGVLVKPSKYANSPLLTIHLILNVIILYAIFSAISLIVKRIIIKVVDKTAQNVNMNRVIQYIDGLYNK